MDDVGKHVTSSIVTIPLSITEAVQRSMPKWKKVLMFLCGISGPAEDNKIEKEEEIEHTIEISSLHQTPREKMILYFNLVLVCIVAVFLFIFYSVPDGGPTAPTIKYGRMLWGNSTTK